MSDKDTDRGGLFGRTTNYGDEGFARFLRRTFLHSSGMSEESMDRPVVAVVSSKSDFNTCHRMMPELVDAVKRGIQDSGGLPFEVPTISLGEPYLTPTSMVYRNLMALDVEAMLTGNPIDGAVLVGGCDKTVPAQLMGAATADVPAVQLVTGPMMTGRFRGERLGACTDCRRYWAQFRSGAINDEAINRVEHNLATTAGTCAVMGTASTMASLVEVLGLGLPMSATAPAVHSDRLRIAHSSGAVAVALARDKTSIRRFLTLPSFRNALRLLLALGGSTNAIIHLTAVAGRVGIRITPEEINEIGASTPVLVDLKPSGDNYMEDLHAAGGIPAVLSTIEDLLDLECPVVEGGTLGERIDRWNRVDGWCDKAIVRPRTSALFENEGLVALRGTLAPDGALLKVAAASPELLEVEGRAVVFSSLEDLTSRIDDPELDVEPTDILVLQNAGPKAAGMPEAGYLPIPGKLAARGVKDMVRVSDARMSGTAYGTVVLHIAPEASVGGPLSLVRAGDRIRLSVSTRTIDLLVDDAELERRRNFGDVPVVDSFLGKNGYLQLYRDQVLQATHGCDFRFCLNEDIQTTDGGRV